MAVSKPASPFQVDLSPMVDKLALKRIKNLKVLYKSITSFLNAILGKLTPSDDDQGECVVPENIVNWFTKRIRADNEMPYRMYSSLIRDVVDPYTQHKYINVKEYESKTNDFVKELQIQPDSLPKVLYLANLTLLLRDLIDMTSEQDASAEEKALNLSGLDLVFPDAFAESGKDVTTYKVIVELRTQIFIQHFFESLNEGTIQEWNPQDSLADVFKMEDSAFLDGNKDKSSGKRGRFVTEWPPSSYKTLADAKIGVLMQLFPKGGDYHACIQHFQTDQSWEKMLEYMIPWIYSHWVSLQDDLSQDIALQFTDKGKSIEMDMNPYLESPPMSPVRGRRGSHSTNRSNSRSVSPYNPRNLMAKSVEISSEDSELEEEADVDLMATAKAIAVHRGPKAAKQWAEETFGSDGPKVSPNRRKSISIIERSQRQQEEISIIVSNRSDDDFDDDVASDEDPYELYQRLSRRVSLPSGRSVLEMGGIARDDPWEKRERDLTYGSSPRRKTLPAEHVKSKSSEPRRSNGLPVETRKKSLFDAQPDARRINFDSASPEPIIPTESSRRSPPLPNGHKSPEISRKRQRQPSLPSDGDEDFQDDFTPVIDPEKLKRSRTSAAQNRSTNDEILNRIHGAAKTNGSPHTNGKTNGSPHTNGKTNGSPHTNGKTNASPHTNGKTNGSPNINGIRARNAAPVGNGVRKGLGWAWTEEAEAQLIKCVQTYGTAWSDIAAHFAKKGGPFEGRTQVQLKDKARNLKNKWIKEGRAFPPNFNLVTPYGTEAELRNY